MVVVFFKMIVVFLKMVVVFFKMVVVFFKKVVARDLYTYFSTQLDFSSFMHKVAYMK